MRLSDFEGVDKIVQKSDTVVYIIMRVKMRRGIHAKGKPTADELLIYGFNPKMDPELYKDIEELAKKGGRI